MASLLSSGDSTLEQILSYQATSADLSFDNSYYFTSDYYGHAGYKSFRVYYWNTTTSSWDQKYTQTTSQTNFGYQIACTWDGDRFVVGSPDENKVYVYHSPGGSGSQKWTHNASGVVTSPTVYTISCPDSGSRRFGWSVSIAKDLGNHIVIGAPGTGGTGTDTSGLERGKVYIYEFNGSTWSKTFDKTANQANTDCDGNTGNNACIYQPQVQRYPSATTSSQAFYRVTDSSPQFGYYVDISGYAEYIAIGVPGTGVARLRAQNMDGYTGNIDVIRSGGNSDYIEDIAMLGCIVCYKTTNANKSWSSNTSLHGKPVLGQTEMSLDSVPASYEPQKSFDFTALGITCKISLDGTRLIGGSPRYSYPGQQQSPHFGRLDAWNYSTTDTEWVLGKGRVVGHRTGNRLGMKIAIDYTGQRVAALLMEEPDDYDDTPDATTNKAGLMVYDWNGNGFYEVTPEVQTNLGSDGHNIYASIAISKGDVIGVYAHGNSILSTSKTSFYFYKLTGGFDGNSLVGGYCAADTFLVGPNDGSTQNTFKKQIKFGGTFFDNTYENTTIENRIYQFDSTVGQVNHQGYSELLVSKKTTGAAPDMIRFKSNELRIDNHVSNDQSSINPHFTTSADGEYDHNGALLMNVAGNFKINPTYDVSRYSGSTSLVETFADTQDEVKASLDVEGDIFGRRRINAGYLNGQRILGRKWPWQLLYDTRSGRVKRGDDLVSNTFCEFNAANAYNHGRINSKGTKSGTMVTHYETQGAIKFTNASDYILNNTTGIIKGIGSNGLSGSLWIKLENEHSSYPDSSAGGCTLISYGTPHATSHTGMRLQIEGGTNPNIRFRLGSGAVFPSNGYIFTKDKWYHIYYAFKPTVASKNSYDVWINNVSISSFGSYSLSSATYSANHYIGSPLGDTATNVYIGMVAHFNSHIDTDFHLGSYVDYVGKFPNASEMYYWGSPQEKLAVGGDAFIENRLSIGGTHSPDHPLDVTGDINLTGSLRVGSSASTGTSGQLLTSSGGGAMSWTNKIWSPGTFLHPTVTMTSASSGGYVASASSNFSGSDAYYAFNNVIGAESWMDGEWSYTGSPTGTYTGSISTTYNGSTTVDGQWIQLQVPTSITIDSIKIAPQNFKSANAPTEGKILGSTNGSTWTLIHSFTGQTYTDGQYTTISFSNSVAYSYFRLCVERTGGGSGPGPGSLRIGELKFNELSTTDIYYNTGNVGIGTIGPLYTLDVDGDINMSTGSSFRINGVAQTFPWITSGSDVYRSSGNTGINTSSPLYTLDVDGDINMSIGSSFRINGVAQTFGGGGGGSSVWGVNNNTNNAYYLSGNIGIGTITPGYKLDVDGDINMSTGSSFRINGVTQTFPWTTSGSNIYRSSGNVGIGTTSPSSPLHIECANSTTLTNGLYVKQSSSSYPARLVIESNSSTQDPFMTFQYAGISPTGWSIGMDSSNSGKFIWACSPDNLTNSTKMALTNDGKLGIGTTTPAYKLDVDGDINMSTGSSFRINGVAQTFGGGGGGSSPWTTGSAAGTYPPNAMTSNGSGGYGSSASSTNYSPTFEVFKAFNQTIGDEGWHGTAGQYSSTTRNYTGSFSTTYDGSSTVSGEWIQLQFPSSTSIAEIEIAPRSGSNNFLNRCAGDGIILGSTNGSTWTSIATFSGKTYTTGNYTSITFAASSSYTYFRVVITKLSGSSGESTINISELRFKGGNSIYYPSSGSSSVGIGTTSPLYTLDVDGDINMSTGSSFRINGVAQTFGGGGGGSSPWTTSGSNIYRSSGQVNIGGSTFTRAKLEINGSYSSSLTYRYYSYGAFGQMASGNNSYSIYASQRVASVEFNAFSDRRIKKNITDINDSSALDKIRLLEPKIYNYIDEKGRGTSNVYGFIAQEVANVLPYAVTISEGDIPNILRNSNVSVIDNNTVELTLESSVEELSLSNTSVINIITDEDKDLKCNVLSFSENNIITIENTGDFSNVTNAFIKGEQVSNFHHLNKDAIWAVSTAALQEVDRQLQAEKAKVSTLETQVANLLARVTALENN